VAIWKSDTTPAFAKPHNVPARQVRQVVPHSSGVERRRADDPRCLRARSDGVSRPPYARIAHLRRERRDGGGDDGREHGRRTSDRLQRSIAAEGLIELLVERQFRQTKSGSPGEGGARELPLNLVGDQARRLPQGFRGSGIVFARMHPHQDELLLLIFGVPRSALLVVPGKRCRASRPSQAHSSAPSSRGLWRDRQPRRRAGRISQPFRTV
jgi:hypothetical protein